MAAASARLQMLRQFMLLMRSPWIGENTAVDQTGLHKVRPRSRGHSRHRASRSSAQSPVQ